MGESLPPLKVTKVGQADAIPVYTVELSNNLSFVRKGAVGIVISATTGSAGGDPAVYAATGNNYVVMNLAADLTAEHRLVQSGNSITITTAAGLVTINATTGDLSTKQDTITYPLGVNSGGTGQTNFLTYSILYGSGTFNVQTMPVLGSGWLVVGSSTTSRPITLAVGSHGQMLTVDTSVAGALVWANTLGGAAGAVYAATGNDYVVMNLAGDLTSEYRLVQSGNSITIDTTGNLIIINASTGGGSGAVYAATGNSYVVMNLAADLTAEHRLVQSGNSITISTAAGLIIINAVTNPTLTTQTLRIPMSLLSVEVNSGNAFWTAQTDTTRMDKAYINHVDSGRSVSTWWCMVPTHLNATPAWNLDIFSEAATLAATGGFLVLNVDGMSVATGESANTLAASTIQLVTAGSFLLNTAGIMTMSTMSATNFDGVLATSAMDYVKVKLTRQGNADTFNSDWYIYSVNFRCTVDT